MSGLRRSSSIARVCRRACSFVMDFSAFHINHFASINSEEIFIHVICIKGGTSLFVGGTVPPLPDHWPSTHWVIHTTSCVLLLLLLLLLLLQLLDSPHRVPDSSVVCHQLAMFHASLFHRVILNTTEDSLLILSARLSRGLARGLLP